MKRITPIQVIGKKGKQGYVFTLTKNSYKDCEEIKNPKKQVKLIELYKFLENRELGDLYSQIQEMSSMDYLYIPRPPIREVTEKEGENYGFSKSNEKCENCIKDCKQSVFVDLKCDEQKKKE